jgi:alpha-D-ribose 1-methylphosphonate 5-triphosphate synthase subunit PhnL
MDDLRSHLLARLTLPRNQWSDAEFSARDLRRIVIQRHTIYRHKVLRVNYTTYDMRREQDSINPRTTHCDIMLLSHETDHASEIEHPYWYARVIGIFHADVFSSKRMGTPVQLSVLIFCGFDGLAVNFFPSTLG